VSQSPHWGIGAAQRELPTTGAGCIDMGSAITLRRRLEFIGFTGCAQGRAFYESEALCAAAGRSGNSIGRFSRSSTNERRFLETRLRFYAKASSLVLAIT
jgi:hypothetical protein